MFVTILYARFPRHRDARRAMRAARRILPDDSEPQLHLRRPRRTDQGRLGVAEGDSRRGLFVGMLVGAAAGALAVAVSSMLIGGGELTSNLAWLAGAALGAAFGLVGGGLAGLAIPDRALRTMLDNADEGEVVVTASVHDESSATRLRSLFEAMGAQQVRYKAV